MKVTDRAGLRARKKDATRRALTAAAADLALTLGYAQFTVLDVTERVGVSRRTFSNYFAGKAECLAAHGEGWADDLLDLVRAAPADTDLADLLRRVLGALAIRLAEGGDDYIVLIETEPELQAAARASDEVLVGMISAGVAERLERPADDLRLLLLAEFALLAVHLCVRRWVMAGRAGGVDALSDQLDQAFSLLDLHTLTAPSVR
ncbi:TetR family transcriptional regulator [Nakamurella flavida]|uniref:TetR family transcriptional regulator n=1 Tax=Nakamurella flavida TaxID=363630 RepID=A0A938YS16_9ACTN|nr:TetR/AcrR family transcriptional regulator [Nakamurella flavida]MBM9477835.1 TetR family transcriptional regulator [Nakamurella flavida]MDP9779389.1 AcrR family transcriptional regulator [Nakamurella flavida]